MCVCVLHLCIYCVYYVMCLCMCLYSIMYLCICTCMCVLWCTVIYICPFCFCVLWYHQTWRSNTCTFFINLYMYFKYIVVKVFRLQWLTTSTYKQQLSPWTKNPINESVLISYKLELSIKIRNDKYLCACVCCTYVCMCIVYVYVQYVCVCMCIILYICMCVYISLCCICVCVRKCKWYVYIHMYTCVYHVFISLLNYLLMFNECIMTKTLIFFLTVT